MKNSKKKSQTPDGRTATFGVQGPVFFLLHFLKIFLILFSIFVFFFSFHFSFVFLAFLFFFHVF